MLKYSKQREIIEKAVKSSAGHPSAGDVYDNLHPLYPNLSLGTVYRNLTLLSETGALRKLRMPDGSDRFDGLTAEHAHAVCMRCSGIQDIDAPIAPGLADSVLEKNGFVMIDAQLLITGICKNCAEQESKGNIRANGES